MKKEKDINLLEYEYERLHQARSGKKRLNMAKILSEDQQSMYQVPKGTTTTVDATGKTVMTLPQGQTLKTVTPPTPAPTAPVAPQTPQNAQQPAQPQPVALQPQQQPKRDPAMAKNVPEKGSPEAIYARDYDYYEKHIKPRMAHFNIGTREREMFIASLKDNYKRIIRDEEATVLKIQNSTKGLKKESFDEYFHMIKVSPTKALEHITQQKDLNEFIEFIDKMEQEQIDEKVENRQNFYLFKYNLAHKMGVLKQLQDKENPWSRIYMK